MSALGQYQPLSIQLGERLLTARSGHRLLSDFGNERKSKKAKSSAAVERPSAILSLSSLPSSLSQFRNRIEPAAGFLSTLFRRSGRTPARPACPDRSSSCKQLRSNSTLRLCRTTQPCTAPPRLASLLAIHVHARISCGSPDVRLVLAGYISAEAVLTDLMRSPC